MQRKEKYGIMNLIEFYVCTKSSIKRKIIEMIVEMVSQENEN